MDIYIKSNREKSKQPRGHSSWCPACDKALVRDGSKCIECGKRKLPKRNKR